MLKLNLQKNKYVYFFYAHLSVIDVDKGDPVDTGEVIGKLVQQGMLIK